MGTSISIWGSVMNIAIIRRWDVSAIDGVNRFVFTLADGFRRLGHRVMVFCHHVEGNLHDLPNLFSADTKVRIVNNTREGLSRCIRN